VLARFLSTKLHLDWSYFVSITVGKGQNDDGPLWPLKADLPPGASESLCRFEMSYRVA
jgi:hypothetical protein